MAAIMRNLRVLNRCFSASVWRNTLPKVAAGAAIRLQHTLSFYQTQRQSCLTQNCQSPSLATGYRMYSDAALTMETIKSRVMTTLAEFDKIDDTKLTLECSFQDDLGLDSLDVVELVMALEDEFGIEVDDSDVERMARPQDVIQYIADKEGIKA